MEDIIYAKIIDGDMVFFFQKGYTQKELLESFEKKLNTMKSFFNIGDSIYIFLEDESQYNMIPKIAKLAVSQSIKLAGSFFGELPSMKKNKKELELTNTKIYRKHVRSGQAIENPGDIIIFGNINSGAEVKAGGSVIVFGKVSGILRAGLNTKKNVFIVVSEMASPLIEIAEVPFYNHDWPKGPISIRIEGTKAIVEPLEI
jgi:septum site-determining protein MinC